MFDRDFNVVYVRVMQGCNLNCDHCFTLGNNDKLDTIKIEHVEKFLTALKQNVNPKKLTFYIHGGETFLAPISLLKEVNDLIHTIFADNEVNIIPQTNLVYTMTDELLEFIKTEYDGIGVSWDADIRFGSVVPANAERQETQFFTNFKKLVDAGVNVSVAITAQRHLMKYDPVEIANKFEGASSIDFELLTMFDNKTHDLKPRNDVWSDWLYKLVQYYHHADVSWCLPQIDLFIKSIKMGQIYDCKCNCCDHRTFTLNPSGTVGLCPDMTYVKPLWHVDNLFESWDTFAEKAQAVIVEKAVEQHGQELCYTCEHFEYCGGNCEATLFDDTDECALSRKSISYVKEHLSDFVHKYNTKTTSALVELKDNKKE